MSLPEIRYSELKHLHFVDRENHEMGTLEDIVLDEKTLEPTHLILGSSFFEEFMEEIGERDNIDEIAPIHTVDHIEDDYVILSCRLEDLETTDSEGKLTSNGIMFTILAKNQVNAKDQEDIGELYDYILNSDTPRFVISLITLSEKLYQEGFGQKFNLAVPPSVVSVDNHQLTLKLSMDKIEEKIRSDYSMKQRGRDLIFWD